MKYTHYARFSLAISGAIILGACSEADKGSQWTLIENFTPAPALSKPYTSATSDKNLLAVWQEVEAKTSTANADIICSRTNIVARSFDGETKNWGSSVTIQQGSWQKTSITKEHLNPDDTLKWKYVDGYQASFDSQLEFVSNTNGNAIAAWVQNTVDTCETSATPVSQVYHANYTSSNNSWTTAAAFQSADSTIFLKGAKEIQLAMNASDQALAVWTQAEHYGITTSSATYKTDVIYGASFNGSSWSSASAISTQQDADPGTAGIQEIIINTDTNGTLNTGDDIVTSTPAYLTSAKPNVDINENGDGIVVWKHLKCFPSAGSTDCRLLSENEMQIAQSRFLIEARRFDKITGWVSTSSTVSNNALTAHIPTAALDPLCLRYDTDNPKVSLNDDKQAWITWEQVLNSTKHNTTTQTCPLNDATDKPITVRNIYANSLAVDDTVGTPEKLQTNVSSTNITSKPIDESLLSVSDTAIYTGPDNTALAIWIMQEPVDQYLGHLVEVDTANTVERRYSNRWNYKTASSVWIRYFNGTAWDIDAQLLTDRVQLERYAYTTDETQNLTPACTSGFQCDPAVNVVRVSPRKHTSLVSTPQGVIAIWQQWDDPRAQGSYSLQGRVFKNGTWEYISPLSAPSINGDYTSAIGSGGSLTVSWSNTQGQAQAAKLE